MLGCRSLLLFALIGAVCTSGLAQELVRPVPFSGQEAEPEKPAIAPETPLPPASITKEQIEAPHIRQLEIRRSAEPLARSVRDWSYFTAGQVSTSQSIERELADPDPKLAENPYVATLRYKIPPSARNATNRDELAYLGGSPFLAESWVLERGKTLGNWLSLLAKELPADKLTAEDVKFFTTAQADRGFVQIYWDHILPDGRPYKSFGAFEPGEFERQRRERILIKEFRIIGATEAECERRARAVVLLIDESFSRVLQREMLRARQAAAAEFETVQKKYLAMQESIATASAQLEKVSADSPDMLPGLRVAVRTADADLAANELRLAAYDKLLGKPTPRQSLEDAKVLAEIEQSALQLRRKKLAGFVSDLETQGKLKEQLFRANLDIMVLRGQVKYAREAVLSYDREVLAYGPLVIMDNSIVIRPVKWIERTAEPK